MLSTCTTSSAPLSWCATSFSVFSDSSFFSFSVSRDTSRKALRFFSSSREALSSTDRSLAALRAACSSREKNRNALADVNNKTVKRFAVNETLELHRWRLKQEIWYIRLFSYFIWWTRYIVDAIWWAFSWFVTPSTHTLRRIFAWQAKRVPAQWANLSKCQSEETVKSHPNP